jgi:hypothetical protein
MGFKIAVAYHKTFLFPNWYVEQGDTGKYSLKTSFNHPHLSPLPSRERKQKVPSPLEGEG